VSLSILTNLVDQLGTKIKAIEDQMANGGTPHPDDIKGLARMQEEMAIAITALEPADPTVVQPATLAGAHS
jgi:hypothetical protein